MPNPVMLRYPFEADGGVRIACNTSADVGIEHEHRTEREAVRFFPLGRRNELVYSLKRSDLFDPFLYFAQHTSEFKIEVSFDMSSMEAWTDAPRQYALDSETGDLPTYCNHKKGSCRKYDTGSGGKANTPSCPMRSLVPQIIIPTTW